MHELSQLYGSEEATKSVALERYTVASIVKIIKDNGWEADVDLVAGGHLSLVFTQGELRDIELDLNAAEKAGVEGVETVELLDPQYVEEVRSPSFSRQAIAKFLLYRSTMALPTPLTGCQATIFGHSSWSRSFTSWLNQNPRLLRSCTRSYHHF